jgi:hypothetical protein
VPTPWSIAQLVALVIALHARRAGEPAVTLDGVAVNNPIAGDTAPTVNVTGALVPPAVMTVTWRAPEAAPGSIANVALSAVLLATLTPVTVMPVPLTATVVPFAWKPVPVTVSLTVVPARPDGALKAVIVGAPTVTANVSDAEVAPDVTVIVCAPSDASAAMVISTLSDVALCTFTLVTVRPSPLTLTVGVGPFMKPVPLTVIVIVIVVS